MADQSKQAAAAAQFGEAVAAVTEAGPLRHANVVSVRVERDGGSTIVQAVIFAESADLSEIMAARLSEPTQAERAGLPPHPPIVDEAQYLLSEGKRLGAFDCRNGEWVNKG
ncbi:hypothetical protein [Burkholderia ambifaria]|uniref:hypothetical protein n=1 Tax=Burkholderia ambifaria TaxID=152480 RepID=UPI002FE31D24